MQLETDSQLEELIREEKHKVALEFFQDAWRAAVEEGIEAKILAESAVVTALTELQVSDGTKTVGTFIETLPVRFESGHFEKDRVLQ